MKFLKSLVRFLFSRLFVIAFMIVIQFGVLLYALSGASEYFTGFYFVGFAISIIVVLIVINRVMHTDYKLAMAIPIALFPLFGGCLYLILYAGLINQRVNRRYERLAGEERDEYAKIGEHAVQDENLPESIAIQYRALEHFGGYPLFSDTETRYFALGEEMFPTMMQALNEAKEFIYLEYFIVECGTMWNAILEILQKKASDGVDVRLIYDGIGTIRRLPWGYEKHLEKMGIHCRVYNPLVPLTSAWQNRRDHRKILSVDGKVAFTGGINLADEYINAKRVLGHWKDVGIMVRGNAASSLTVMFRCLWHALDKNEPVSFPPLAVTPAKKDGLVMPYADNPYTRYPVGRDVYLNAISHARRRVLITTPYFVVDGETLTALRIAAAGGVDIRIITPHIGDKWYVHMITRSYYRELLDCGITVYEYSPGFIHAKNLIADGELGICGSVNFDYRSFYLQLECGMVLYRSSAVGAMENDFYELEKVCHKITRDDLKKETLFHKLLCSVLRLFAPLM